MQLQQQLNLIVQELDDETFLGEALLFPEFSSYGENPGRLRRMLKAQAQKLIHDIPVCDVYRRHAAGDPRVQEVRIHLEPPKGSKSWTQAVELRFFAVLWEHGEEACLARVPALQIEVIAPNAKALETRLASEIRFALQRQAAHKSLEKLLRLQRTKAVHILPLPVSAEIKSPKDRARLEQDAENEKPVFMEVCEDLGRIRFPPAFDLDSYIRTLAEQISGNRGQSVLLVGPSGVGKTTIIHELVRQRDAHQLGDTPFWETSGARLVAGATGFGMWQKRCERLCREASKHRAVLCLGSLMELVETGKSEGSAQGLASYFRPFLTRGDLVALVECSPEQHARIERDDPHLLNAFHILDVHEPSDAARISILLHEAVRLQERYGVEMDEDALETLDRLHQRYAAYSASPGRAIRFLRMVMQDQQPETRILVPDIGHAFSRETGLPRFMLDDSVALDLERTRRYFLDRIMGQAEAVDIITGLMAAVKTGLTRPQKPLASMLFIGPTGTGKTELAKALAEFLFGSKERLTRFDMSEFSAPNAVERLTGGGSLGAGFGKEGLLTAKVREQPFSVLLFDEFEKAHPLLFDLFLQLLGEGRLTDSAGRLADFSNTVLIMTSNLGAEQFLEGRMGLAGATPNSVQARTHFMNEVRAFFRPEFFNRIDRIVPFTPLAEADVLKIAERELQLLCYRDGLRDRRVRLDLDKDVTKHLAQTGYSPRYGARPLKRIIERQWVSPLAEALNRHPPSQPLQATIGLEKGALKITVKARVGRDENEASPSEIQKVTECAHRSTDITRLMQRLEHSAAVQELRNEGHQLEQQMAQLKRNRRYSDASKKLAARLALVSAVLKNLERLGETCAHLNEEALLSAYGKSAALAEPLATDLKRAEKEWPQLLIELHALHFRKRNHALMAVYGEHLGSLFRLADSYHQWGQAQGFKVKLARYAMERGIEDKESKVALDTVKNPAEFLKSPKVGVLGILLEVTGKDAALLLSGETGRHVYHSKNSEYSCLVEVTLDALDAHKPPPDLERKGALREALLRRQFETGQRYFRDEVMERTYSWTGQKMVASLSNAIADSLKRKSEAILWDEEN